MGLSKNSSALIKQPGFAHKSVVRPNLISYFLSQIPLTNKTNPIATAPPLPK
jgi:hypothetical protein